MKTYDLVKRILEENEQARNSDKLLIWEVYKAIGIVKEVDWFGTREALLKSNFISAKIPTTETIRRSRADIQRKHPELEATSKLIRKKRQQIADQKGTHIYRETY